MLIPAVFACEFQEWGNNNAFLGFYTFWELAHLPYPIFHPSECRGVQIPKKQKKHKMHRRFHYFRDYEAKKQKLYYLPRYFYNTKNQFIEKTMISDLDKAARREHRIII